MRQGKMKGLYQVYCRSCYMMRFFFNLHMNVLIVDMNYSISIFFFFLTLLFMLGFVILCIYLFYLSLLLSIFFFFHVSLLFSLFLSVIIRIPLSSYFFLLISYSHPSSRYSDVLSKLPLFITNPFIFL